MRGILGGGFWGLVVGGAAVAGASLLGPAPNKAGGSSIENTLVAADGGLSDSATPSPVSSTDAPDVSAPATEGTAPPDLTAEAPVGGEAAPSGVEAPAPAEAPAAIATDEAAAPPVGADDQSDLSEASVASDGAGAEITSEVGSLASPEEGSAPALTAETETAPTVADSPAAAAAGDTTDAAPVTDTAPADQPVVATTETLTPPAVGEDSGALEPSTDAPVTAEVPTPAPETPDTDTLDLADADVADPPGIAPEITATAPEVGAAPEADTASPDLTSEVETVDVASDVPDSPTAPADEDDLPETDIASAGGDTEVASGPIGEGNDGVVIVEPEAPATDEVEVVIVEDDENATPTVSVLPSGSGAVKVNRFGADEDADETPVADAAPEPESFPEGTPALVRYGVPGENPNDLPELSVVLVDDGNLPNAVAAVADINFPVSVMLNPSAPDAAARMTAYRAAGIEVGLLAKLPPSATPSDVAIFFEAALSDLPETVAVLDAGGETQADTGVIRETVAALAEDGRGLITVPRGLNSAQRVASESGVAAGVIYRDLDSDGQDARVISRFMDQAAFRARQDSGVILLGRVRDETVTALTDWATGSRATQVAMQPVSAVLSTN